MRDLAAATLSEGLTARTSLSRISCHSSVVKVQRPGHDSPRRRRPMMGLCGRGVKPTSARTGMADSVSRDPVRRHGGECTGRPAAVKRSARSPADRRQIGPRLDEQDEGRAAEPAQQRQLRRAGVAERADEDERRRRARPPSAAPALASRSRISMTRLLIGAQTARRPWSARIRVTSSAYSRSPPTGRPAGDPAHDADVPTRVARRGTSRSPRPRASGWSRGSPPRTARRRASRRRPGRGARGS